MDAPVIDDDPRAELAQLVRDLRARVGRHARAGAFAAPGGASPGPELEAVTADAPDAVLPATAAPAAMPAAPSAGPELAAVAAPLPRVADDEPIATIATIATIARERLTLGAIRSELGECTRCKLHTTRTKIVFGVGADDAALMFVGEAPGADEDRTGEPFVGKAGQLLDKMIEAMGWRRGDVYIANVLKCRPPGNRNPEPDEVSTCQPFLSAQIASVRPRVLVALGRPAANALLATNAPISALRGRFHDYRGIRLMPTFHPAFLLRSPDRKRDAWNDLKQVMAELERLGIAPPGSPRG